MRSPAFMITLKCHASFSWFIGGVFVVLLGSAGVNESSEAGECVSVCRMKRIGRMRRWRLKIIRNTRKLGRVG